MKSKRQNPFLLAAITLAGFAYTANVAHADDFTWDADPGTPGAQDGSGTWENGTPNWTNTTTSTDNENWADGNTNKASFGGGTDGTYAITLVGTPQAGGGLVFDNSGYTLSGSDLSLKNGTGSNGTITVKSGNTATINSSILYNNNKSTTITVNGILNLNGGMQNSQYKFGGAGTVNMTDGSYQANTGNVNVPTFNQTGGTFNLNPGNNVRYDIGNAITQNVNYSISGGILILNGNASTATVNNAVLSIGEGTASDSAFTSTLTVETGGTVNIGTTASRSGEIRISRTGATNGHLDIQGGDLTIGTGSTANKVYLFHTGSNAGISATMTQSGGTVTSQGIQFGTNVGSYDLTSSATLQLSGGSLYVGTGGITRGVNAGDLPVAIQLQGGTLGASGAWSSSMDMQLGTTGGGPIIRAANSGGAAQNITLSGILSNDGAVDGTLTKTGAGTLTLSNANSFSGATTVSEGTLVLGNADAASTSSSLTIADAAALSLTSTSSTVNNLTFTNTGTLNFNVDGGGTDLTVVDSNGVTNSGAAGSIAVNITGAAPATGTYPLISYTGSLQGSGFSAYQLGTYPAGLSYALSDGAGVVELVVSNPHFWTGAQNSEWSTNAIAGSKNWTQDASPADYVNGAAVVFDDSATTYTVDVSVADVTPASVTFNNNGATPYTLQGSKGIAGSASLTKLGSQTLQISNPNTYTGATTVTAGTLKLGAAEVLPDGIGTGNVTVDGTLDLNGFSETINGLSGAVSGVVDNTAVGSATLTVGNGDGSGTIFSTIQNTGGSLGIVKVGSGQLFLRGNSSFTGGVLVTNGTLNGGSSPNAMGTGGVTLGGSGSTGATFIGGQDFSANVNVTVNPPDSGNCVIGANGAGSGMVIGSITLNSADVTVETFVAGTTAATTVRYGVTGTGNLLLNNLSTTAGNRVIFSGASVVNNTGTITSQGTGTTSNFIGADIGANVTGIIQNSATALLVLDGINSYSGNTTVNAGILRINKADSAANANPNNDASTVTIASGAQMNLQYTGTDIVDKLFFGPTQQPAGEYSSSGVPAGATIPTNRFLGGGTITVSSSPGGGFSSWITGTFANGTVTNQGPNDDDDNDGISNLVEYAIAGQDPTVPDSNIGSFTGGTLSYSKRLDATGLTYAIQDSVDLGITDAWAEVTGGSYVNDATTISYTLTPGTPAKNFIRLQVVSD